MVKNKSHTLAYSLVALQEMNLAYNFPIMFWNCACLISDSGGAGSEENEDVIDNEDDILNCEEEIRYETFENFTENQDEQDDEDEDEEEKPVEKAKKKTKSADYGRIATAIGKLKSNGIDIIPPDINKSSFTFTPDIENNAIRYGLSGIIKVGEEIV